MTKIIPIKNSNNTSQDLTQLQGNDKDWAMVKNMISLARSVPQKNVTKLVVEKAKRKTKLSLVLMPQWGIYFPPYNLSRLSAISRDAGYETSVWDINIASYHFLKNLKNKLDIDPWDPAREFYWLGSWYIKNLHSQLEPLFREFIDKIVNQQPDVIGFSLYYANETATCWIVRELKKRLPNCLFIAGGPQALTPNKITSQLFDHIVQGEGEQLLLEILDKKENNLPIGEKVLAQPKTIRLDLDSLPFPDYSDYEHNLYQMPNGASSEISRGCVAQCVFCTEVHFWKYRGRMSHRVVDEVEYQFKTHGLNFIWFIDSLVNGNLKELRAFAQEVVRRKLPIHWQGYARCDKRMDLDYFKDLKSSGCVMLNYGIESGSQQVLDDMKKYITVEDIEKNLQHGSEVGVTASTNWIVGFPTEDKKDFADTLTLAYRIRNFNISNISPGITMMLSPGSEITTNTEKFFIHDKDFMGQWTTKDLSNTKLHRMIRQKNFLIFLHHLNPKNKIYGFDRPKLSNLCSIKYNSSCGKETIPYEDFNYSIIKTGVGQYADSIVNEIWPLLRTFYRAYGKFEITMVNDPELDILEWGHRLGCNYSGIQKFSIDDNGNWDADFTYKFIQDDTTHWQDNSFEFTFRQTGQWK